MIEGRGAAAKERDLALWLDQVSEPELVGGKAWNLSRMVHLGLPVPRGFVLTDAAFQSFLEENDLHREVAAMHGSIDPSDHGALSELSRKMRERVLSARLPLRVREALREGYRRLAGEGLSVIVRSSAVGEDSGGSSFAGQLDSFPDVLTESGAERAVLACWASCWSDRSLYYQASRGVRISRMGVVVQEQVAPRAAGVLFTVSPEPGAGEAMLGEYCLGHGEGLVSGRVNPGRFTVSREGFRCEVLAEPEQQEEAGGSFRLEMDPIRTLRRMGLLLEDAFGMPQDIEWALDHDGKVHVVQSRPVTALPSSGGRPRRSVLWSNANMNENYPDPASPFLYSIAADGYYHYFRNLAFAFGIAPRRIEAMEPALRGIIGVHCSRLYYNLSNIHAALRMAPFGEHLVSCFNIFVGAGEVAEVEEGGGAGGKLSRLAELARIVARTSRCFLNLERGVARFEARVEEYAARRHPERLERAGLAELNAAVGEFHDIRCHRWTDAALADAASMIGYGLLKRLLGPAFKGGEGAAPQNTLLQGLPGMVSVLPSSELWELSRAVRESAGLRELFREEEDEIWLRLQEERYAPFRLELGNYLERWGFRRSGELMLTVGSFQEEPRGVLSLLKNYLALEGDSPAAALHRQERERERETRRVMGALRRAALLPLLPWPNRATLTAPVLAWTQRAVMLRERARLKQSLLYSRLRRVLLRIGEELVGSGHLAAREDVFYLTRGEIDALVTGRAMYPGAVRDLVALRQREQKRHDGVTPPDAMALAEGEYYVPGETDRAEIPGGKGGGVLPGTGACGGKVTARATVLSDVAESGRLAAGDILVTRQTDPGWAPVFFLVSGLVMERGGMLSHGAIVAREFGIPTVVGVREATKRIPSGTTVTVDGDAGCVRLME